MNIEELSKSQLLLLTLLVNFVVAIATSIVTVSLLQEAPPIITQTVNRIVERTVETIVPDSEGNPVTERTVIVKEEDLVISAVAAAQARTVTLKKDAEGAGLATGALLPRSRGVATLADVAQVGEQITVVFADGTNAPATYTRTVGGVALYSFASDATLPNVPTFALVSGKNVRAGQSIFAIAADKSVVTGIISFAGADRISTTLAAVPAGSQVVNASGDVVGLAGVAAGSLVAADAISDVLAEPAAQ